MKLRDSLEELTCFLESNNATLKINKEDLERNEALEIARNSGKFAVLTHSPRYHSPSSCSTSWTIIPAGNRVVHPWRKASKFNPND